MDIVETTIVNALKVASADQVVAQAKYIFDSSFSDNDDECYQSAINAKLKEELNKIPYIQVVDPNYGEKE